jgi:hypothetical protein
VEGGIARIAWLLPRWFAGRWWMDGVLGTYSGKANGKELKTAVNHYDEWFLGMIIRVMCAIILEHLIDTT